MCNRVFLHFLSPQDRNMSKCSCWYLNLILEETTFIVFIITQGRNLGSNICFEVTNNYKITTLFCLWLEYQKKYFNF